MTIKKRYSQFDKLREHLVKTFPNSVAALPPLPPKTMLCKTGVLLESKADCYS